MLLPEEIFVLKKLTTLLEPFEEQTDLLQCDLYDCTQQLIFIPSYYSFVLNPVGSKIRSWGGRSGPLWSKLLPAVSPKQLIRKFFKFCQ